MGFFVMVRVFFFFRKSQSQFLLQHAKRQHLDGGLRCKWEIPLFSDEQGFASEFSFHCTVILRLTKLLVLVYREKRRHLAGGMRMGKGVS